jgi:hypothetical protein
MIVCSGTLMRVWLSVLFAAAVLFAFALIVAGTIYAPVSEDRNVPGATTGKGPSRLNQADQESGSQ